MSLFIDYTKWHYSYALLGIFVLGREFVRFVLNLFSFSLFMRTLISPIYSIRVQHIEEDTVSDILAVFIVDVVMRLVGTVLRLISISFALFFSVAVSFFCVTIFILWLIMPLVYITLIYGVFFFISDMYI